jgi:hypothetical protein
MSVRTRRELFADVGRGMFAAGLGFGVASDLGLAPAWAAAGDEPARLTFGDLEPLVAFLQETPADKLLPAAVEKLNAGTELKSLVAAAALANARAFGGEDYIGYHTLMALPPAFHIAAEESRPERRPLAVLKVLHRNSTNLQNTKRNTRDALQRVQAAEYDDTRPEGEQLREAVRKQDAKKAEGMFAGMCGCDPEDGLNALMWAVDDGTEVHRTVLVARAWELVGFVGKKQAHTLLRQSVRYCLQSEKNPNYVKRYQQQVRDLLPKLLDKHNLLTRDPGTRTADDTWVQTMADTIFKGTAAQAAEAAAMALAEGFSPDAVSEAVSLATNQLILRDTGRAKQESPQKPPGSIHGDSIGVHACDSAHAWRSLSRAGDRRTKVTSVVLSAYQAAYDRVERGGDFLTWTPYPRPEHAEAVRGVAEEKLLTELDGAIREKNQVRAAALVDRLRTAKADAAADVFTLMRGYAVSEDGALHAEKFFRTATEEYAASRPAFRWRHLIALARVTASMYGTPAPGYEEARKLLKA